MKDELDYQREHDRLEPQRWARTAAKPMRESVEQIASNLWDEYEHDTPPNMIAVIAQALLSERRKGWEMCRDATMAELPQRWAEVIRALPFPEDKA